METVFTNSEIVHVFNEQNQKEIKDPKTPLNMENLKHKNVAYLVLFKLKEDLNYKKFSPATAAYKYKEDAMNFLESVKNSGGKAMIIYTYDYPW